jgi:RhtB (resistance to homoserine/threonine) family protein
MDFLSTYLIIMTATFVALISPGPDFLITMRNALGVGRASGIATAIGVGAAIATHVAYSAFGIALIISQSVMVFNIIKYLGAAYLIYCGVMALRSKGWDMAAAQAKAKNKDKSLKRSFVEGFVTNVLNPKATLFFLALFTQVLTPDTPMSWQVIYGLSLMVMVAAWFSFVAVVLTHEKIRQKLSSVSIWIDRVTGGLFIALGLKVALSKINS